MAHFLYALVPPGTSPHAESWYHKIVASSRGKDDRDRRVPFLPSQRGRPRETNLRPKTRRAVARPPCGGTFACGADRRFPSFPSFPRRILGNEGRDAALG